MADSSTPSFVELMTQQRSYGPLMDDKNVTYQLIELYNGTYWSLAIKEDQPDLPYVTIELISDDGKTIVRAVRIVDYKEDELSLLKPQKIGTYGPGKTLRDLCQLAEKSFTKLVDDDKREQFNTLLVKSLGYEIPPKPTTSQYYKIEVRYRGFKQCFLGTQNMTMLFSPPVQDGNLATNWEFTSPPPGQTKIINRVTDSNNQTYMKLGRSLGDGGYSVLLEGPGQDFWLYDSQSGYNEYIIYTIINGGRAYLQPQASGEIVAVVDPQSPTIFRVTNI